MRQLAFYGKGGIGKSTIASNLSASMAERGHKVMQVGCDPKQDSTSTLTGIFLPSILETFQNANVSFDVTFSENSQHEKLLNDVIYEGFSGVVCVEAGGPKPGVGCAGRGVLVALDFLTKYKMFEKHEVEVVIYDVLGDVVCGGFAAPLRKGYAGEVYLVTSAEMMSLYAANNIAKSIQRLANERKNTRIGGIIHNQRNVVNEIQLVEEFAWSLGVPVMEHIPRSDDVQLAELQSKTVIEALPESPQAQKYRDLAEKILNNEERIIPSPLESIGDIQALMRNHQGR